MLKEIAKNLPSPAREFWLAATEFVEKNQAGWESIQRGTPEMEAWRGYFRARGWRPFGIRMIDEGRIMSIVMPTQWPEWFEGTKFKVVQGREAWTGIPDQDAPK